jgi:hypothetical protein
MTINQVVNIVFLKTFLLVIVSSFPIWSMPLKHVNQTSNQICDELSIEIMFLQKLEKDITH